MAKDIWVIIEEYNNHINQVSFELLSKSVELNKELRQNITAVLFSNNLSNVDTYLKSLAEYGANQVLVLLSNDTVLISNRFIRDRIDAELLYRAVVKYEPLIILAGATSYGRTLMPLVSSKLETGLTADCTDLKMDGEILVQTRPAFGGNIMASIECAVKRPQMATVRPGIFKAKKIQGSISDKKIKEINKKDFLIEIQYDISDDREMIVEILERYEEKESENIADAEVIVAGGRGLGKPEGFNLLKELAVRLGGVVGPPRGAVDLGWIDHSHLVGQTGHTVNPKLYIACGISGAIQHVAGMKGSNTVIAINEDPEAPIFDIADYGIIGDLYEIIPAILKVLD